MELNPDHPLNVRGWTVETLMIAWKNMKHDPQAFAEMIYDEQSNIMNGDHRAHASALCAMAMKAIIESMLPAPNASPSAPAPTLGTEREVGG